ncbi:dienelactone hydrolase family protein [Nocardia gamkensis]|uniref:dienelactone hydrolase family protein n=1 Tax=Nocardia TaxID=1817 RepID=UPI0034055632
MCLRLSVATSQAAFGYSRVVAFEITAEQIDIIQHDAMPMAAYISRPARPGDYPLVLVGAELWGLTNEVRAVVRDVAALGYVAIAPNLYHRSGPDTSTGIEESDANRAHAFELLGRLTRDGVEADLRAAADYAREHAGAADRIGMLGFSLGGHVTYFAATRLPLRAAAIYYPGWLPDAGTALSVPDPLLAATSRITARLTLFFAEQDHVIDADQRRRIEEALSAASVRHEIVVYPGARHAFFFPGREPYDKQAADDSWQRVRELFAAELSAG